MKNEREIRELAEKLAKQNYPFVMERDETGYYISVPDIKGCSTWIRSLDELEQTVYEVKLAWIETALKKGLEIPQPTEESKFSGKFLVRCPKTIHKRLVETARREGVSLNHYVVSILAENSLGDRALEIAEEKIEEIAESSFERAMRFAQWKIAGYDFNFSYLTASTRYSVGKKAQVA